MTGEGSVVERIDNTLNAHYYTIAYCVVITAYVLGFAEYVYLRLVSILIPEKMKFYKTCQERADERVGKDGWHYGVSVGAFVVIALFQLICFFGLTISEKWTKISHFGPSSAASLRRERVASQIRTVIHKIMYRTFLCYGLCSGIICMLIFYMVGIQDSIGDTGVAPLVHNTTATRLASLAEIAEPSSYSASPLPSAVPPLSFPNFSERDRPESLSGRSTHSAREPPQLDRGIEIEPFRRGSRQTTTV
ncbi:unnamed protein product, partial [Mesorhabditis spiculigera]